MRLLRIIIGELVVLVSSVLVFRSIWTLLDKYTGDSNLELLLATGIIVIIIGLILLNYEVKHGLEENNKKSKVQL